MVGYVILNYNNYKNKVICVDSIIALHGEKHIVIGERLIHNAKKGIHRMRLVQDKEYKTAKTSEN